jgi:hypothetical protein
MAAPEAADGLDREIGEWDQQAARLNVEQSNMHTNMNERDQRASNPDTPAREYPVTYDDASRYYGPCTHAARERHDELSMREHLARAYAKLTAAGTYDPARHGTRDTEPLTAAERLELPATAEHLSRTYKPTFEIDHALRAGASWAQVAEALGADEVGARAAYRAWADRQHDMLTWTNGRLGMSDAEYAEVVRRAADGEQREATRPCAHADRDGEGAHWLPPGEKRRAEGRQEQLKA